MSTKTGRPDAGGQIKGLVSDGVDAMEILAYIADSSFGLTGVELALLARKIALHGDVFVAFLCLAARRTVRNNVALAGGSRLRELRSQGWDSLVIGERSDVDDVLNFRVIRDIGHLLTEAAARGGDERSRAWLARAGSTIGGAQASSDSGGRKRANDIFRDVANTWTSSDRAAFSAFYDDKAMQDACISLMKKMADAVARVKDRMVAKAGGAGAAAGGPSKTRVPPVPGAAT
jgi:hypothetical protein